MFRSAKPRRRPDPIESEIQSAVLDHWRLLGRSMTLVAAIPNANAHGQPGLTPGLADLLVMGPDIPNKVAFMELTRRRRRDTARKLTATEEAQENFARLCARLGLICITAHGRDEPIAYLERWNVVRDQRYPEPPGWDQRLGGGP
jgi:hypothetical protein